MLSEEFGDNSLYEVSDEVEKVMWDEKKLFANADFFHASAYYYMGISKYYKNDDAKSSFLETTQVSKSKFPVAKRNVQVRFTRDKC